MANKIENKIENKNLNDFVREYRAFSLHNYFNSKNGNIEEELQDYWRGANRILNNKSEQFIANHGKEYATLMLSLLIWASDEIYLLCNKLDHIVVDNTPLLETFKKFIAECLVRGSTKKLKVLLISDGDTQSKVFQTLGEAIQIQKSENRTNIEMKKIANGGDPTLAQLEEQNNNNAINFCVGVKDGTPSLYRYESNTEEYLAFGRFNGKEKAGFLKNYYDKMWKNGAQHMFKNELVEVKKKAQTWLQSNINDTTRQEIERMLEGDEENLIEAFYKDLEFGTGGLRGIMGVGSNRINIYTVGMVTQGLSNYLLKKFRGKEEIRVAIAYDCRNNSPLFAQTIAEIFTANNIKVYLFEALRPTPELSFAIRHFKCQSGVMVTASHNPKEYNGYKVYWEDGGQIIAPHDTNIIEAIKKIDTIDQIQFTGNEHLIEKIGETFDDIYTHELQSLSINPEIIEQFGDLSIVSTPIHGTGVQLVPLALKKFGFRNIINVPEQDIVDGNFPTVLSPNPEEPAALKMAIDKAIETKAELVMATDPDSDRVGIAVKNEQGKFILLNGNQTGALLSYYIISQYKAKGLLKEGDYIVKTIVTSEIISNIAKKHQVPCYNVLTGFKFIADIIRQYEGKKRFIYGGEESYGYLAGEFVRDKDAVMSCALIAETAAWAKSKGKTLLDLLKDISVEYGLYSESLKNLVKTGKSGTQEIQAIMDGYRKNPPQELNKLKVTQIKDYLSQKDKNCDTGEEKTIELPKSNVLQFFLADGSKISVRPSGTEPKIKYYFSVKEELTTQNQFDTVMQKANKKIDAIIESLGL